jgi:hypothetical protein
MNNKIKMIAVGAVSLIVGAAVGAGYGMMQVDEVTQKLNAATQEKEQSLQETMRVRKLSDDATKKYGKDLGKLVLAAGAPATAAAPAAPVTGQPAVTPAVPDDGAKMIDGARALLALRDGFRASLDGVRASMNSEMDALAAELGTPAPNAAKVKELLDSMKQNWPEKDKNMQAATQKLLADLGLVQAPKPAAAPAPAPASAPAPVAAPAPAPADGKK